MNCPNCNTTNRAGAKFCVSCGTALALACPSCGTLYQPGERFCAECGAPVGGDAAATPATERRAAFGGATPLDEPSQVAAVAERRLVTVLFADLVAFTTRSEEQDPEETRDLLTRYFDTSREVIERYGGTVEKFIGDAVMAVWGTPSAHEDDPERAVRAGLDLVDRIARLADEAGAPGLALRAGVMTGEAAVTLGATNQGMVAGDLVNTASRLQSAAAAGTVLVGEATRRATEAAIAYEAIGEQVLKGKAAPVAAWRALRVLAGRGGALRYEGLEPPFVGRDREFRLVKDLLHASANDRKAHLVSVIGPAGIGKSRLAWEVFKYIDGLRDTIFWHQGRCLAYGEGVTYWALADMIRSRAGIAEGEASVSALAKLHEMTADRIPDAEERAWIEPRLAHLLGLEELAGAEKDDLFGAWRLFFERLADTYPTVLAFEDMQWADPALVEFLQHLLDWSRNRPILVLSLARPEMTARHPTWGQASRSFTSLYLEPLPDEAMRELLAGLVPGVPDELSGRILARAEGIPMYAVETVRMLLDRGLLARDGANYRATGDISELQVPESLQALIAARLDALSAEERSVVQDAAVLGKTFAAAGISALSGRPAQVVDDLLAGLARKELLTLDADPRSPERGQYGFLQDLVRAVAYESLARRDRRRKHLAAARFLEETRADDEEIIEVVASHYIEAHRLGPDLDDAAQIRARAQPLLRRAADRAASLGAPGPAERLYRQAVELADDPVEQAQLWQQIGDMAFRQATLEAAEQAFKRSLALYEAAGRTTDGAWVAAQLADVEYRSGRADAAVERAERAFLTLADMPPSHAKITVARRLAAAYYFTGRSELALERAESALAMAEALGQPEPLAMTLGVKAMILRGQARVQEGLALQLHAVALVRAGTVSPEVNVIFNNLGDELHALDRYEEALVAQLEGLALARRFGARIGEWFLLSETMTPLVLLGRWDEALQAASQVPDDSVAAAGLLTIVSASVEIHVARGNLDAAQHMLELASRYETSPDFQERGIWVIARARIMRAEGEPSDALRLSEACFVERAQDMHDQVARESFVEAVESALAAGDVATAERLVSRVEALLPGQRPRYVAAHARRFRGLLSPAGPERETALAAATGEFRAIDTPFWVAVVSTERAESLLERGDAEAAAPLLAEARSVFERLGARPWLDRLARSETRGAGTPSVRA